MLAICVSCLRLQASCSFHYYLLLRVLKSRAHKQPQTNPRRGFVVVKPARLAHVPLLD